MIYSIILRQPHFVLKGGIVMIQIKSIKPKDDYRLEVQFENGNSVTLDFTSRLNTVRFGLLADKEFFLNAVTDGTLIQWENKIELSAEEVFQLARR